MKKVLENIKALRAIRGYSQEYIAEKLGCDYSTYGKIENGKSSLSVNRLFQLAEILEVDPKKLLGKEEIKFDQSFLSAGDESHRTKLVIEIPITEDELDSSAIKDKISEIVRNLS